MESTKDVQVESKAKSETPTPDSISQASSPDPAPSVLPPQKSQKKGYQFWLILLALCVATLLVAIDLSIISTALPTITKSLSSSSAYVWIANAYVLSSTAVQPLYGQTANIFGRRSLTLFAVVSFIVGSAMCGWAKDTPLMISGRTMQGIGGGGIITLGEIIMCDLVPLRERGKYTGIIAATYAIGTVLGPILGGVFTEKVSWRWIFWINLPIGAVSLALIVPFLHLKYPKTGTLAERLKRVDILGNVLLIAAVSAILVPLSTAGTSTPWTSGRTLAPLILGLLGLVAFGALEASGRIPEPTMPAAIFSNRTSVSVMVMAFLHGLLLIGVTFFLPVYWQAVRSASPLRSGINGLPVSFSIAPGAALSGAIMSRTGTYRWSHFLGFGLMAVMIGCLSLYDENTTTAVWVIVQFLFGVGCGIVYTTMIPPMLASLSSKDTATAAATWSFMRSFGQIWGVAIPSAVFNSKVNSLVTERLGSWPEVAQMLMNGGAYERATKEFMKALADNQELLKAVKGLYIDSLKVVWYALMPWAIVGVFVALGVKSLELSKTMDNDDFGIEEKKKKDEESGDTV